MPGSRPYCAMGPPGIRLRVAKPMSETITISTVLCNKRWSRNPRMASSSGWPKRAPPPDRLVRAAAGSSAHPVPVRCVPGLGARVGIGLEALDLLLPTVDGFALVNRQEGQIPADEFLHLLIDGTARLGIERSRPLIEEGVHFGINVLRVVGSPPTLRGDGLGAETICDVRIGADQVGDAHYNRVELRLHPEVAP